MPDSHTDEYRRVLAVDTSTRVQSIALLDGDELLEERTRRVAYNHGSSLLDNIDAIFDGQQLELGEIDLFCAGIGPGSFTGLRVGLASAKALSRAADEPIVGVSSLAAQAWGPARINPEATILSAIDARRREVYAGAYRWSGDELVAVLDDRAAAPDDWVQTATDELSGPLVQIGNGAERYDALRDWAADHLTTVSTDIAGPSAVGVARLGRRKAIEHGGDDRVSLQPNYIRPSDAVLPDKELRDMPEDPDQTS